MGWTCPPHFFGGRFLDRCKSAEFFVGRGGVVGGGGGTGPTGASVAVLLVQSRVAVTLTFSCSAAAANVVFKSSSGH